MNNDERRRDPVAIEAERALYGTAFEWLRSQQRRRALCVVCVASLVLVLFDVFTDSPFVALGGMILFIASLLGLRRAVRKILDLPDRYVDERMRQVRGEVYRLAFIAAGGLVGAIILLHIGLEVLQSLEVTATLSSEQWFRLMFVQLFALMSLPNLIYAWRERDV